MHSGLRRYEGSAPTVERIRVWIVELVAKTEDGPTREVLDECTVDLQLPQIRADRDGIGHVEAAIQVARHRDFCPQLRPTDPTLHTHLGVDVGRPARERE